MTYQIMRGDPIRQKNTPDDGTVMLEIEYEHGDADATTFEVLTFSPATGAKEVAEHVQTIGQYVEALRFFERTRLSERRGTGHEYVKAELSKTMPEERVQEIIDDVLRSDVVYGPDHWAQCGLKEATIWFGGSEFKLKVLKDMVQL